MGHGTSSTQVGLYALLIASAACSGLLLSCDQSTAPPVYVVAASTDVAGSGEAGSVATPAPTITVTADGQPAPGLQVQWSAEDGGSVEPAASATNPRGEASTTWTLGPVAGVQHLRATVSGATVRLTATALSGSVTRLALAEHALKLGDVGDSLVLAVTASDRFGNRVGEPPLAWTSLNPAIVTVSGTGVVRGVAGGSARVVVSSGGCADSATVEVAHPVGSVAVAPHALTLSSLGAGAQLTGVARDRRGASMPGVLLQWTSADTSVATVGASGVVSARRNGGTIIYGRLDTFVDSSLVTVRQAVASVALTPASAGLTVGDSLQASASAADSLGSTVAGVTWSWATEDSTVASVSGSGSIRALRPGTVGISASAGGVSGRLLLTVAPRPPVALTVEPAAVSLRVGQTLLLSTRAVDALGGEVPADVTWSTSDASRATVEPDGRVRAVSAGAATITARATAAPSVAAQAQVTILPAVPAGVHLAVHSVTLHYIGATAALPASVYDASGNVVSAPITYSIDIVPWGAASVSAAGVVTQLFNFGMGKVIARSGSSADTAALTLTQVPRGPLSLPDSIVLRVGQSMTIGVVGKDSAGFDIWPSATSYGGDAISIDLVATGVVVHGVNVGSALLGLSIGSVGAYVPVRVLPPLSGAATVRLSTHAVTLNYLNATYQLAASAYDAAGKVLAGEYIRYATSSPHVTLSGSGLVTQVSPWGNALVVASAGSGSDTAVITVRQVPNGPSLLPDSLLLSVGDSVTIGAAARDSGGSSIYPSSASYGGTSMGLSLRGTSVVIYGRSVGRTVVSLGVGTTYVDVAVRVVAGASSGSVPPASAASSGSASPARAAAHARAGP